MLTLLDPYPIKGHPRSQMTQVIAQLAGHVLSAPLVTPSALDLARRMADDPDANSLPNALRHALRHDPTYKAWKSAMPRLSKVPALREYRRAKPMQHLSAVASEIALHGDALPPQQTLFHGGVWPFATLALGDTLTISRPLSTSLCPQVAAVHANYHKGGALWAIEVASPGSSTHAFVFSNHGQQTNSQEYEVLLAPSATLTCVRISQGKRLQLIEVTLS